MIVEYFCSANAKKDKIKKLIDSLFIKFRWDIIDQRTIDFRKIVNRGGTSKTRVEMLQDRFLYSFPDGKNKLKNNLSNKFYIKPYKKEKKMEK